MMLPQTRDCGIGNGFRRLSQATICGKACRQRLVLGQEKDTCARARSGHPFGLDFNGDSQIAERRTGPIRHALREAGGQICGEGTAANPR